MAIDPHKQQKTTAADRARFASDTGSRPAQGRERQTWTLWLAFAVLILVGVLLYNLPAIAAYYGF